jgi:glycine oxidase
LRPGTSARVPFLCRLPEIDNVTIAAGHFRSGLQMSPATAVFMRQLILEQDTLLPPELYAIDRSRLSAKTHT